MADLMTQREVAEYFSVHFRTVALWADKGTITRIKIPGSNLVWFARDEIHSLVEAARIEAKAGTGG